MPDNMVLYTSNVCTVRHSGDIPVIQTKSRKERQKVLLVLCLLFQFSMIPVLEKIYFLFTLSIPANIICLILSDNI